MFVRTQEDIGVPSVRGTYIPSLRSTNCVLVRQTVMRARLLKLDFMKRAVCEEKVAFVGAYQKAAKTYSEAVAELQRIMGKSSKADYDSLYRMAEALRMDAVQAKEDLEAHTARHKC